MKKKNTLLICNYIYFFEWSFVQILYPIISHVVSVPLFRCNNSNLIVGAKELPLRHTGFSPFECRGRRLSKALEASKANCEYVHSSTMYVCTPESKNYHDNKQPVLFVLNNYNIKKYHLYP